MTSEELKQAFLDGVPVTYTVDSMPGMLFNADRIEEIVYKKIGGNVRVSANVLDKSGTLITIPHRVVQKREA